ncbi:MAG: 50S ribosomal protein L9, partial [Anaerolineae bacterium]|nr:50S ribosomal protein L9 [Anaerolineae bacterium]
MWVRIPPALLCRAHLRSANWRQTNVKIILTRDVPNLGQAGDVKDVATGYARNYLIPKGLAAKATTGALKEFKRQRVSV